MRSSQGTYSLASLPQTTLPLWPVSRPAPGPAAPPQLWLTDAAVALPPEEFRSFAAVLGYRGRLPSQAINGSIQSVEVSLALLWERHAGRSAVGRPVVR